MTAGTAPVRRILHMSDLHFGRDDPALEAPLVAAAEDLAPDLIAVSGDLTQRARVRQFARARAFLDRIAAACGAPVLAVPGNHDTPLDNLWLRLVRPWARYRAAISADLEPRFEDAAVSVVGVNTVNRFAWQRGRISDRTVNRVLEAFGRADGRLRIVVLHHPLEHGADVDKRLMTGAGAALDRLQAAGADMVLSGHLHSTVVAPFASAPGLLFVQAGTGLSTRVRGEPNTFNLIEAGPGRVTITPHVAGTDGFGPGPAARFRRGAAGWRREDGV